MDYRIDFLSPSLSCAWLRQLASPAADGNGQADAPKRLGLHPVLRHEAAHPCTVVLSRTNDRTLFALLSLYFSRVAVPKDGLLVQPLDAPAARLVGIITDPEVDFGQAPVGSKLAARELLSSLDGFSSTWPSVMGWGAPAVAVAAGTSHRHGAGAAQSDMVFGRLLPGKGDAFEVMRFLICGGDPKAVMEDMVRAPSTGARGAERVRHQLPGGELCIEATALRTGDGPAVELRVPIALGNADAAIMALAVAAAASGTVVNWVTQAPHGAGRWVIRRIRSDGGLAAPRRVERP